MVSKILILVLVILAVLRINHIIASTKNQPHRHATNLAIIDTNNQETRLHDKATEENNMGTIGRLEKSNRSLGGGRRQARVASLFNFECGNHYEPVDENRRRFKRFVSGGYDAGLYSYPSYMKIMIHTGGFMFTKCGGTLISRQHIITATHCFPNGHGNVFAESTIYQQPSSIRLPVARVCHLGVALSDITILRLDKPVRFTPTCQPACIPNRPITPSMQAITVGLGANYTSGIIINDIQNPDELQALPVRRVECKFSDRNKAHICFRPNMSQFSGASCKGDSGGPTYAAVNGKQTVYSIVSYGSDHICLPNRAGYSVNGDIYNLRNPIINLMKIC